MAAPLQTLPSSPWPYFNPLSEIDIRDGGNLPHWDQGDVWYFVTFRLADALPSAVLEKLQQQREEWLSTRDFRQLTPEDLADYHRLFSERYNQLLDTGSGSCVLRDAENASVMERALCHFEGERYELDQWVVMPNHVHVLVRPLPGYTVAQTVQSWKSYTAHVLNRRLKRTGQLWQHESYDHIVRNPTALHAIRHYIRENPNRTT